MSRIALTNSDCVAEFVPTGVRLAHGDEPVDDDMRRTLIESVLQNKAVELDIKAVVYRQGGEHHNRKHTLFTDDALQKWTRLSVEWHSPFSQDHSLRARDSGGYVLESEVISGPGIDERAISERIRLAAPWAVLAALRSQMRRFSIYWRPVGSFLETVLCSVCKDFIHRCTHYRGELIRAEHGNETVKFIFTDIEPVERSWVLVPAVENTQVTGVERTLSEHEKGKSSMERQRLLDILQLSANTSESAIITALQGMVVDSERAKQLVKENSELRLRVAQLEDEIASIRKQAETQECETVIGELRAEGRISKGDRFESLLRQHFESGDRDLAKALVDAIRSRPPAVPTGPPQRDPNSVVEPTLTFSKARGSGENRLSATDAFELLPEHIRRENRDLCPDEFFRFNPDLQAKYNVEVKRG